MDGDEAGVAGGALEGVGGEAGGLGAGDVADFVLRCGGDSKEKNKN